ncbi:MAG TPA: protein kinase [Terriglobales bacterium]|nr:protein kinase [Terriglobales bacterium]
MIGSNLSHYRVIEKIGAGGMGVVFRAHDQHLDRDVALKVLPQGALADEEARSRFRQEALLLSRLSHPNIATVFDFDTQQGVDFLAMELIPGMTLADRLLRGPLPERDLAELGAQVADALQEAHEHGILHRDLKPGNVMVSPRGAVKVLDFGLAKALRPADSDLTQSLTDPQAVAGTLPYMAPEQVLAEKADARTDLYALGALLYEAATGRRPFPETQSSRLVDNILHQPPLSPRALNPRLTPELERIILKCLEKDPGLRYQSAREVAVDLRRLGRGASSSAAVALPVPQRGRLGRKVAYAGAAVVVVVAAALLVRLARRPPAPTATSSAPMAVAVLPFQNVGADHNLDFLGLAVPDELVTTLSYVPALAVRPFSQTQKYQAAGTDLQAAGRDLHVRNVVTGHYLEQGSRISVTLEMVEVENNRVMWRETVSGPAKDLISLKEQITARVRQELLPLLGASASASGSTPRNPEAYDLYLRSLALSRDNVPNKQAIALLERSLQLDPDYAPAWLALGRRCRRDAAYGEGGEAQYQRALPAFQRALQLDPNLTEAAARLIEQRVERGELNEAYDQASELVRRRPDSAQAHFTLSYVLRYTGLNEEAGRECDTALALDPGSSDWVTCSLAFILLGRYDRARDFLQTGAGSEWVNVVNFDFTIRTDPSPTTLRAVVERVPAGGGWGKPFFEACINHRGSAELDSAAASLVDAHDSEPSYWLGGELAFCGRRGAALRMLRDAIARGYCAYPALDRDPVLASLRALPSFAEIRSQAMQCQKNFLDHRIAKGGARLR